MSAQDSNSYFIEIGEYSLVLAKANVTAKPRAVEELREIWLGDAPAVDAALKELKGDGKAKAVALLRLKGRTLAASDAGLLKRVNTSSAAEAFVTELVGSDRAPANWAWVSQKDGRTPDGSTPWILEATPTSATDEGLAKLTGWGFDFLRCESASLATIGALTTAARSGTVLVCDVSEMASFLTAVSGQGVVGFASIPVGFDALAEATQGALGLKFRGSAARLMFNESYDFAEAAPKIIEPLANAVKGALGSVGGSPTQLVFTGILARQTWLSQALASALGLKLFAPESSAVASANSLSFGPKVPSEIAATWLGVVGAIAAYDSRNPGATLPWNPTLTNTPVAPAPVVPAVIQDTPPPAPAPKPAVVIPPAPKAEPVPAPAPKVEPPKPAAAKPAEPPPAAPAPKPAVVITPPPKPVEPPKTVAKTPPPPAKQVDPKATAKPEAKAPAPAAAASAKPPAKAEPAKPVPAAPAPKPTLAPAPAPVTPKAPSAAPFPEKKSKLPIIAVIVILVLILGGGGYFYSQAQKEKEAQAAKAREADQRAAAEAAARRAAEEKAKQEADARKKAEAEAAQRAVAAEKARIEAEEKMRAATAEELLNARGGLTLNTDPAGATVSIGELAPRQTPVSMKDLRLGRYSLTISLAGYDNEQRDIDIKANEVTDLGTIKLHRQVGSVEITSDPNGLDYELKPAASLFVNPSDVRKGQTPVTLNDVPAGSYQLTITKPGWQAYTATVSIERNNVAKAHGTFVGGTIVINSTPSGATVLRDGNSVGTTPLTLNDVTPGDVTFTISQRGYDNATVSGKVESGKTLTLNGTLLDPERVMKLSELDERPVPLQQVEPELTSGMRSDGGTATIEFVVGKDGIPTDVKIVSASNPAFGRACMAAAAKWRFRPGVVHSKAVRTRMILPFRMTPES
ncbi:MAG TPA: TonB family protein [Opitutaceae bacterium]|nr:TonB family protein [Opitutaceae bacterium]